MLAAAAALLLLSSPVQACQAVVPILIGPLQVLLAILPAMLVAIGASVIAMFKPSAIKAGLKMLWHNKLITLVVIGLVAGSVYAYVEFGGRGQRGAVADRGNADWPVYRGGPDRRGWSGQGDDPCAGNVNWAFKEECKTFYSSPAVVGNRIYVISADKGVWADNGAVYCLDAKTKLIAWKYAPKGFRATFSSPSVAGKYVVVGEGLHVTRDSRINCLDADTGALYWEYRTASHVESSPCIADGKCFVGAGDDGLYCIDLAPAPGGKPKINWHLEGKDFPDCETSPVYYKGRLYWGLGMAGSAVVCVDAATGKLLWKVPTPSAVFSSPCIAEPAEGGMDHPRLFVGMGSGNFVFSDEQVQSDMVRKARQKGASAEEVARIEKEYAPGGAVWAFDISTDKVAKPEWTFKTNRTVLGTIAAADGRLYFGTRDGEIHCLTTAGQPVAKWNAQNPILTSPAVAKDHVYFVTQNGRLYGLDRRNLKVVWQGSVAGSGEFLSSPAVGQGHVYVGSSLDGLICMGQPAQNGEPCWGGCLGGPGQSGWVDGCLLPDSAEYGWRFCPAQTSNSDDASRPAQRTDLTAPAAHMQGALYLPLKEPTRTGLVRLNLPDKTRRRAAEAWHYPTPNPIHCSPVIRAGRVFCLDGRPGDKGRSLHCLNLEDGKAVWAQKVGDDAPAELVLADKRLLAYMDGQTLALLETDKPSAVRVWQRAVGQAVGSPACSAGAVLVAVGQDKRASSASAVLPNTSKGTAQAGGALLALNLTDGSRQWQAGMTDAPVTGAVATKDLLAIGTGRGLEIRSMINGYRHCLIGAAGEPTSPLVCNEELVAFTTASGVMAVDWQGRKVLALQMADVKLPPMLCGDSLLVSKAGQIKRLPLAGGGESVLLEYELANIVVPPIMVDSVLYFGDSGKGLICARPARK